MAVVAAIYSTLGLARTLADELRHRELIGAAFGAAFVLILIAIAAVALRVRPSGVEVGIGLGVIAVYGLVFVRMAIPEERTHVIEYGVVAVLLHEALAERARAGRRVLWPGLVASAITVVIGVVDELIQLALPQRVFDPADMLVNSLAALGALGAKQLLAMAARWRHH